MAHIDISRDKIISIINKFNPKKTHGCDGISVSMLQLCADEIAFPLSLIFDVFLQARFLIPGKKLMYSLFTKNITVS